MIAVACACLGTPLGRSLGSPQTTRAVGAGADPFAHVVAGVRPCIVAVGSYHWKDKPTAVYVGTGFVIHDGYTVVTNAHVVDALRRNNRLGFIRVFFPDDDPVNGHKATVMGHDRFHDLSILRFEGPRAPVLRLELDSRLAQGESVGIMGYPIGISLGLVPAVHRGVVAAVVPAVLPLPKGASLTPQLAEAIRRPYNLYQLDLVVFPGNSGSPLFDAQTGRVFGIINKTLAGKTREHLLEKPSGIAYAVPSRWIHELLMRSASMTREDRIKELKRLGLVGD